MIETFDIAGYCRISVDDELDRDNVSIENQKAIIQDFVKQKFPGSTLTFYEDRDRSGYTFEQREGYQTMRNGLINMTFSSSRISPVSPAATAAVWWSWKTCGTPVCGLSPSETASTSPTMMIG